VAIVLLAEPVAHGGEYGSRADAGIVIGQPSAHTDPSDEVADGHRVRPLPATPRGGQQTRQHVGQISGEAPGLTFAQLVR
jgi:hypothetical protein